MTAERNPSPRRSGRRDRLVAMAAVVDAAVALVAPIVTTGAPLAVHEAGMAVFVPPAPGVALAEGTAGAVVAVPVGTGATVLPSETLVVRAVPRRTSRAPAVGAAAVGASVPPLAAGAPAELLAAVVLSIPPHVGVAVTEAAASSVVLVVPVTVSAHDAVGSGVPDVEIGMRRRRVVVGCRRGEGREGGNDGDKSELHFERVWLND